MSHDRGCFHCGDEWDPNCKTAKCPRRDEYDGKVTKPLNVKSPHTIVIDDLYTDKVHPSHQTRASDSSLYDEVCRNCGATDGLGDKGLFSVCPKYVDIPGKPKQAALDNVSRFSRPERKYYSRFEIQPMEFIARNKLEFWQANVIKYICRYDAKDQLVDLYKARDYLNLKIKELEGDKEYWIFK